MRCKTCCCSVNMRIAIATIGVFVGILAGVWFAGDYHNYNSAAFGFVSAILALITMIIHIKYKRRTLDGWASKSVLWCFMIVGCVFQAIGVAAFITYIVLGIVFHQGLSEAELRGENYWVSIVWAWMTWKWAFALFWFSKKYLREYLQGDKNLEDGNVQGKKFENITENVTVSPDGESIE